MKGILLHKLDQGRTQSYDRLIKFRISHIYQNGSIHTNYLPLEKTAQAAEFMVSS